MESSSGFKYRLLDSTVADGYEAASAQLLPGEKLYRMMGGNHRVMGELSPALMEDAVNFYQSAENMATGEWDFHLAAGVPAILAQHTEVEHQH